MYWPRKRSGFVRNGHRGLYTSDRRLPRESPAKSPVPQGKSRRHRPPRFSSQNPSGRNQTSAFQVPLADCARVCARQISRTGSRSILRVLASLDRIATDADLAAAGRVDVDHDQ